MSMLHGVILAEHPAFPPKCELRRAKELTSGLRRLAAKGSSGLVTGEVMRLKWLAATNLDSETKLHTTAAIYKIYDFLGPYLPEDYFVMERPSLGRSFYIDRARSEQQAESSRNPSNRDGQRPITGSGQGSLPRGLTRGGADFADCGDGSASDTFGQKSRVSAQSEKSPPSSRLFPEEVLSGACPRDFSVSSPGSQPNSGP
jgi:hypothetical protein